MLGNIVKISRFCVDDGPGIRTVVFVKGCPLRCLWCHNPESQSPSLELMFDTAKCINCGRCLKACARGCHASGPVGHVLSRDNCVTCGRCAEVCPASALAIVGRRVSADEVIGQVVRDAAFYKTSGGGVTVSGGEPLYQAGFTAEILRGCRQTGIHTALETCGYAAKEAFESTIKYCDYVMYDIKETDRARHKKYTGVSSDVILSNLKLLDDSGVDYIIRLPIVPGFNDSGEHFDRVNRLTDGLKNCKGVQIMPYHSLGGYKYAAMQRNYACAGVTEPDADTLAYWKSLLGGAL